MKKILAMLIAAAAMVGVMGVTAMAEDTDIYEIGAGKTYETWSAAVAAATDADGDGAVTYRIYGGVSLDVKEIKGNATTINIVGMTDDATLVSETARPDDVGLLSVTGSAIKTINFSDLILSRPNGGWRGNEGHHNCFFSVWDYDASTEVVKYTNCVFPNGAGNNQFGKTTYTKCTFNNDTYYALWIYGSGSKAIAEVTDCTFVAARGVKIYSEDNSASVATTITESTFAIADKPAIVSSIAGTLTIEKVNATACKYGLLASEPKDGNGSLNAAEVTVDGASPEYVAKVGNLYVTDIDYAEAETSATKPIEVLVAEVDGEYYTSLTDALKALKTNSVLTLIDDVTITEKWDNRYTGAKISVPVTINGNGHTLKFTNVINDGFNYLSAFRFEADATVKNLVFDLSEAVSEFGGRIRAIANKADLVVDNCTFIGNAELTNTRAIIYGEGAGDAISELDVVIENSEFINWTRGISDNENAQDANNVTVTGNSFDNSLVYLSGAGTIIFNNNTTVKRAKAVGDAYVNIRSYTNKLEKIEVTGNDTQVILTDLTTNTEATFDTNDATKPVLVYSSEDFVRENTDVLPNGTIYVTQPNKELKEYIVNEGNVTTTETVELVFVPNTTYDLDALPNTYWDIVLVSDAEGVINRLNSADFTFVLKTDSEDDDMKYEIIATNDEIVINNVDNDENRYEFHYNGKTEVETDTATRIIIGMVEFTGFGEFTFNVVANTTNAVHTTTLTDNVVDTYTAAKSNLIFNNADENEDDDEDFGTIDSAIIVPTKTLTINIDFPNSVENNVVAYQQMKVVVSGGELEAPLTIDLGTTPEISDITSATYDNKDTIAVTVTDLYTIVIENLLEVNTTYNVEVSGAGYRTARYSVTMTKDKTLNFWNNVKDNAIEVEEGKDTSKKNITFLAGDIVKDSNINIYDLSAVVSYFGEIMGVNAEHEYAKYDLNRDGKIDSKDVAYVLVSWNN